jgi:hypothetical protein
MPTGHRPVRSKPITTAARLTRYAGSEAVTPARGSASLSAVPMPGLRLRRSQGLRSSCSPRSTYRLADGRRSRAGGGVLTAHRAPAIPFAGCWPVPSRRDGFEHFLSALVPAGRAGLGRRAGCATPSRHPTTNATLPHRCGAARSWSRSQRHEDRIPQPLVVGGMGRVAPRIPLSRKRRLIRVKMGLHRISSAG